MNPETSRDQNFGHVMVTPPGTIQDTGTTLLNFSDGTETGTSLGVRMFKCRKQFKTPFEKVMFTLTVLEVIQ